MITEDDRKWLKCQSHGDLKDWQKFTNLLCRREGVPEGRESDFVVPQDWKELHFVERRKKPRVKG